MCGLAGFIDPRANLAQSELESVAGAMSATLRHRGPDDAGVWSDPSCGIAFGHRRLAILDLSPAGHQPMVSHSGRWVIVYNGEVYTHAELRADLAMPSRPYCGHSDTETLVEAVEQWGVAEAVRRCIGMFAFCVWDRQERRLSLVRDRLGIKPLYYGWLGNVLVFASELKAIRAHPAFRGEIDRAALTLYLQHGYVPAPYSIYRDIYKLPPGTILTVSPDTDPRSVSPVSFWSMRDAAERGMREPFRGSPQEAVAELERRLSDSVRLRLLSDVPVGAFLSGGIDSTSIVALMQAQATQRVRTFSIGFEQRDYDEAPFARAVAQYLKTDHTEYYVTPREAQDVVPHLPQWYDEPFADSSQIPTYLVSQLARRHVTVSLSGDGGDELFGGYDRYRLVQSLWRWWGWIPRPLRGVVGEKGSGLFSAPVVSPAGDSLRQKRVLTPFLRKVRTLASLIGLPDGRRLYTRFHTHWRDAEQLVVGGSVPATDFSRCDDWAGRGNILEEMMYVDSITYLPDDILVKVDRASMAVGLEARVPLLDHRLVEFAWTLPARWKMRRGCSKWILRQLLDRHVPRSLVERPKVGFGVPLGAWLRGPLRDWAESLLAESRLTADGFFAAEPIRRVWQQHLTGQTDWQYHLWNVLMFQAWLEPCRKES